MIVSTPTDLSRIPEQMRRMPRWVVFTIYTDPEGKLQKIPCSPTGQKNTGSDGTKEWHTGKKQPVVKKLWFKFDDCVKAIDYCVGTNLGFAIEGATMMFVDLDHAFTEEGKLTPTASRWVDFMKPFDPYIERSVSGNGVHMFCWYAGKKPATHPEPGVEVYVDGRFAVITGREL